MNIPYGNLPAPPKTAQQKAAAASLFMPLAYDMNVGAGRPMASATAATQQTQPVYGGQAFAQQQQSQPFNPMAFQQPRSPWANNRIGTQDTSQLLPQQPATIPNHLRNWRDFRNFSGVGAPPQNFTPRQNYGQRPSGGYPPGMLDRLLAQQAGIGTGTPPANAWRNIPY
jgi:hypothetical protein